MSESTVPWHKPLEVLQFEYLARADLARIYALHEAVLSEVDPAVVKAEPLSFFSDILAGAGAIIGCFDGVELTGFSVFLSERSLLSPALESLELAAGARVVELAGTNVLRAYRGHRLQVEFTRRRARLAAELGFDEVFATASPLNRASWRNLLSGGLHIVALRELYGGQRYVLQRNVQRPLTMDISTGHAVGAEDIDAQRTFLRLGEHAISYRRNGGGVELLFAQRPVPV